MRFVRLNLIISKGTSKNVLIKYILYFCVYMILNRPKSENLSIYIFSSTSNGFQMSFEFLRFTTIAFRLNTTLYETQFKILKYPFRCKKFGGNFKLKKVIKYCRILSGQALVKLGLSSRNWTKVRVWLWAQSDWTLWSLNVSAKPQAHWKNCIDTHIFLVSVRKIKISSHLTDDHALNVIPTTKIIRLNTYFWRSDWLEWYLRLKITKNLFKMVT